MHNGIKSIDRRILAKQEQQQRAIEDGHALPVVPALPVVAEAKAESEAAECSYHISPQMLWVAKLRKRTLQKGALIFNQSAKEGLKSLQETKLLPTPASPADIASFLRFTPDLNKERIGEFLGKNTEETKKILTEYIHTFDFTNISVLTALRMFLDTFRLPGEAQQIDRIMESFATYAYEQTKDHDILINPDVTYCFCFSVIMLNTDLHNPNIAPENRMTEEGFIKNCRGINDGGDFPREYLLDIYHRIQENAISLKEDDMARQAQEKRRYRSKEEKRQKAFSVEKMDIMNKLKVDIDDETTEYFEASGNEYIGPMFKILFPMVIDVYAKVLELSDDESGIENTLTAVKDCFEISCSLGLDQERDRSMEVLSDSTLVNEEEWLEVKNKQIEMIRVMLELAQNYGNHMGSAWKYILTIVSSLAQVHLYGLEPLARKMIEEDPANARTTKSGEYVLVETAREKQQLIESIIDLRALDRIFAKTANLDSKMIIEFVKALCDVSLTELKKKLNEDEEAQEKLKNSAIEELVTTNSVPHTDLEGGRVRTLCIAPLLARAIKRIHDGESVSSLFRVNPEAMLFL